MPTYNSQFLLANDGHIYEVIYGNDGIIFILDQLYVAKFGNNLNSFPAYFKIESRKNWQQK